MKKISRFLTSAFILSISLSIQAQAPSSQFIDDAMTRNEANDLFKTAFQGTSRNYINLSDNLVMFSQHSNPSMFEVSLGIYCKYLKVYIHEYERRLIPLEQKFLINNCSSLSNYASVYPHPFGIWLILNRERQSIAGIILLSPPDSDGIANLTGRIFDYEFREIKAHPKSIENFLYLIQGLLAKYSGENFNGNTFKGIRTDQPTFYGWTPSNFECFMNETYFQPNPYSESQACTLDPQSYPHLSPCAYTLGYFDRKSLIAQFLENKDNVETLQLGSYSFFSLSIALVLLKKKIRSIYRGFTKDKILPQPKKSDLFNYKSQLKVQPPKSTFIKKDLISPTQTQTEEENESLSDEYQSPLNIKEPPQTIVKERTPRKQKQKSTQKKAKKQKKDESTQLPTSVLKKDISATSKFNREYPKLDKEAQNIIESRIANIAPTKGKTYYGKARCIAIKKIILRRGKKDIKGQLWELKSGEKRIYFAIFEGEDRLLFLKFGDKKAQENDIKHIETLYSDSDFLGLPL